MDVALIHWPDERAQRGVLAKQNMPRLLLLAPHAKAPVCLDPLEDWVRIPASDDEVRARVGNLMARSLSQNGARVDIDAHGVVSFRSVSAHLTPVQARLAELLIQQLGAVVTRAQLISAGWPGELAGNNTLEAQLVRLRRRIGPLDLRIRSVRSRGYLMEIVDPGPPGASQT